MDNRGPSRQVPSFNDAFGGRDRLPSDMFGDVRRQLHDNVWGQTGMDWPSHGFGDRLGSIGQHFPDDFDNLRRRFHDLKPRTPAKEEFGSSDSLDGDSARSLITEDTHNKSRTFEVHNVAYRVAILHNIKNVSISIGYVYLVDVVFYFSVYVYRIRTSNRP